MRRIRGEIFLYGFKRIKAAEEFTVDYGRCPPPLRLHEVRGTWGFCPRP
jgi:hypothetical protein